MFSPGSWFNFGIIGALIREGWEDFLKTDLTRISYADLNTPLLIGGFIAVLVMLKLLFVLFGRKKYAWADSGHLIYNKNRSLKSVLAKLIVVMSASALVVPLTIILTAIADPFLNSSGEERKFIQTRTMVYIRDVSVSMASNISNTQTPKSKLAMDAHLRFLRMRFGKGDRTSLWLFSDNGYMINDFIVDDKLQYFQAYDAPWGFGIAGGNSNRPEFPDSRLAGMTGEGGSALGGVLGSVVEQFDRDEEARKKLPGYRPDYSRSVLIYSDADIFDLQKSKAQIDELVKRRVVMYVVLVDERTEEQIASGSSQQNPFLEYIVSRGGKVVLANNITSMTQAHAEIDRLERVRVEISKQTFRISLFDKFIFLSILAFMAIIPLGLFTEFLFKDYP